MAKVIKIDLSEKNYENILQILKKTQNSTDKINIQDFSNKLIEKSLQFNEIDEELIDTLFLTRDFLQKIKNSSNVDEIMIECLKNLCKKTIEDW